MRVTPYRNKNPFLAVISGTTPITLLTISPDFSLHQIAGDLNHHSNDNLYSGYYIYLHEAGQFWPGPEMDRTGQSKPIFLGKNQELRASFMMTEKSNINKKSAPCIDDQSYSYSKCIVTHVSDQAGCSLNWFSSHMGNQHPVCTTKEDILRYETEVTKAVTSSWTELSESSGCYAQCMVKQFQIKSPTLEPVTWKQDWSSTVFLTAENTMVRIEQEFWVFDISDMINGIGGAMGLFLGWSLLKIAFVGKQLLQFFLRDTAFQQNW